jgi:putative transposase
LPQAHVPQNQGVPRFVWYFLVVETQKIERDMRFIPSIFGQLLEPINRKRFEEIVERHDGDAYDKTFKSWDHLATLVFAQYSSARSLRALEAGWNAACQHHYHFGGGELARSTLSDANARRPPAVFADVFQLVANQLGRRTRQEGDEMVRLIDSTPIPLGKLCDWAKSNGRIRGMKMHVLYDPKADAPRVLGITDANVNDAQIGRTVKIESGGAYVFDKGYCHYGWWRDIAKAGSIFVTRPKKNMGLEVVRARPLEAAQGEGFTVLEDDDVRLSSKGDSKLPMPLRRVRVERHNGKGVIVILTNDLKRSAVEIGALYKGRWQIELLFRWLKQHLKLRKFLGNNDNAIRLQLLAAMIAFALLRIATRRHCVTMPILRFTGLVAQHLLDRRPIEAIEKPLPVHPSAKTCKSSPNQLSFCYA